MSMCYAWFGPSIAEDLWLCGGLWHDCEHWLGRRTTRCTSGVCRLARDGGKVMASFLTSQIPVHRDGNCLPTQNTDHARHRTASLSVMALYWMDGDSCEWSRTLSAALILANDGPKTSCWYVLVQ